jgi:hypothetical protein
MAIGIDAVEDLTLRLWPCPVEGTMIGVFTTGSKSAHWLVVGEGDAWVVAFCEEGDVSQTLISLVEALPPIYPAIMRVVSPGAAAWPERAAEHVSIKAHETNRKARRGMAVIACLGALGLLVGIGGFAASRTANFRVSEATAVRSLPLRFASGESYGVVLVATPSAKRRGPPEPPGRFVPLTPP